ncbi:hypothetical protein [Oricola sp.]|uniref:hypothetical protein n=1 Tax=Oricola sp. TaxID=1979950 RepID=UPI00351408DD
MNLNTVMAIVAILIVIVAAIVFGKNLETEWFTVNPRTDVVSVNTSAQLIKQDASERAIILIGRNAGDKLPAYSSCAEPPPDALQDIARSISASFDAMGKLQGEEVKAAMEAADDLKTASKSLFERSQGIQLLRDTMFRLCEAFQNGVVDPDTYGRLIESLILNANFIIPFEQCMGVARSSTEINPELAEVVLSKCLESAAAFNTSFIDYTRGAHEIRMKEKMIKIGGISDLEQAAVDTQESEIDTEPASLDSIDAGAANTPTSE